VEKTWIRIVNELVLERGEKHNGHYRATITSREVLERAGAVITPANHRNVRAMIEMNYPLTQQEANKPNAQNGWIFHMRVRSK
jgi:hypothetical protein